MSSARRISILEEPPPRVLLVENDLARLRSLEMLLEPLAVELSTAIDAADALRHMSYAVPDLVVVDGSLRSDGSGLGLLREMRDDLRLARVPVVLQASSGASRERYEAIDAGAAYCVTKTHDGELLLGAVRAALRAGGRSKLHGGRPASPLARLRHGTFEFRTLVEANELASELSQLCPSSEQGLFVLIELMTNAIEHGNLEISYEEKACLCHQGEWSTEIARRLALPEYCERRASVRVEQRLRSVAFQICDEGPGFAWEPYLSFDPRRAHDPNGRGIALSRSIESCDLYYEGRGNIVNLEFRRELA